MPPKPPRGPRQYLRPKPANQRYPPDPCLDPFAPMTFMPPPPPPPPIAELTSPSGSDSEGDEGETPENEEAGMTAAVRHLYRQNGRHRWRTTMPDPKKYELRSKKAAKYAVVVRREKDNSAESGSRLHSVTIQSPLLRQFLDDVFVDYVGVSTKLNDLTFSRPFKEFVHRWDSYEALIREATEETQLQHIELLHDILAPEISPVVFCKREMIEKNLASFQILWSLFEPNCEVYSTVNEQERVFQLQSCDYQLLGESVCLVLQCNFIDYNGTRFGYTTHTLSIPQFDGHKPLSELNVIPLDLHPDRPGVEARLKSRGKRFQQLKGFHYQSYSGRTFPSEWGKRSQKVTNRRIVVDAKMYHSRAENYIDPALNMLPLSAETFSKVLRSHPANYGAYTSEDLSRVVPLGSEATQTPEQHEIQEHQYLFCTSDVKGYDLKSKSWIKMQIDGIHEIDFNHATFDKLILPNSNKELILSLVESHLDQEENKFDDIVEGKGKGMVVLLSGGPGIGKTLTAEAMAEQMKKPLFSMSAGQLGPTLETVEDDLDGILEICANWNAVLLLDEADVFLEKRQLTDIKRNKLVSVFLRLLEYYDGCMFLTTNRVEALDPAIKSRIDLHVDYGKLDGHAKRHIWQTFVRPSANFPDHTSIITDEDLDVLAKLDINGREIKNLVKTGRLLAQKRDEELGMEHLKTVLSVQTGVPMI